MVQLYLQNFCTIFASNLLRKSVYHPLMLPLNSLQKSRFVLLESIVGDQQINFYTVDVHRLKAPLFSQVPVRIWFERVELRLIGLQIRPSVVSQRAVSHV